ncbi:MAG: phosphodiester glycosidase family protein, partial [Trueperaceae bacterium]|nr:phosphodiester glycosidase family protein [Trueperaceae bacterium]
VEDGVVVVAAAVARALGAAAAVPGGGEVAPADPGAARLTAVRTSGDVDVRVVLDLEGVAPEALRALGTIGRSEAGAALHLELPPLALPADLPTAVGAFDLRWRASGSGVRLEVGGVAFAYDVFALAAPTRLVLDLRPDRGVVPADVEVVEQLAPGVVYRTFRAAGRGGPSRVHVLEVAPNGGEWRVVGASGDPRSTRSWAAGAFAAINGGYFEPANRTVIGLLVVDGEWRSPPSRGRAAVGFGPDGVLIDRVRTRVGVSVDGRLVLDASHEAADRVALHPGGAWAGSGSAGVLVLDAEDRVTANRVGPVLVPADGRAIVYPPELRALALVDPGARVGVDLRVEPSGFAAVRYAVEAGPLLLRDGRPAFAPEDEAFARGVRILDEVTQQAAIGVRADGTVLLVAAEAMVASDLIAVFERLGARDAMRLDSGGSTTLVAGDEVLNRSAERSVATAIVWHPTGSP